LPFKANYGQDPRIEFEMRNIKVQRNL